MRRIDTLVLSTLLIGCFEVAAGEWTFLPRLSVEQVYSDNIGLAPEGREFHEFVTSVEPGLVVRGQGRHLNLSFDYNLEGLVYKRDRARNALKHQMQTRGDAELWDNIVFLEFAGSRSQENASNGGSNGTDNLSQSNNNRTEVQTFSVAPIVRYGFGSFARFEARYEMNAVSTESGTSRSTSGGRRTTFQFESGDSFARAPWRITYSRNRVKNSSGGVNRFRRVEGELRYQFSRRYGVVFRAGLERNKFPSTQPNQSGRFWSYGVTWNPTPRTTLETSVGRAFFGRTMSLDFSHRSRRFRFSASFNEATTTTRDQQIERILIPLVDALGNPIIDPLSGTQIEVPIDNIDSTEEVFVASNFNGSVTYTGRRTSATLGLSSSFRTGQQSGASSEVLGARVNVNRQLSRRSSLSGNGRMQTSTSGGGETERYSFGVLFRHNIGPTFSGTLGLDHVTQRSSSGTGGFSENRVRAGVIASF